MGSETKFVARVTMTVEVSCPQPWSRTATLEQVYEQARREATDRLVRMLGNAAEVRSVGGARVEAVIIPEADDA